MPVMSGEVYDALTEAGASAEKARKAAEAVAGYDGQLSGIRNELTAVRSDLTLLKWMVGSCVALVIAVLVKLLAS
jgi:hypothetical protein